MSIKCRKMSALWHMQQNGERFIKRENGREYKTEAGGA